MTRAPAWLVAIAATGAAACKSGGPVDAFLAFLEAVQSQDAEAAWAVLARPARARLEAASARLRELTGETVAPGELLLATAMRAKRGGRSVRLAKVDGDRAVIRVELEPGGEDEVAMVREEGTWRVALGERPAAAGDGGLAVPAAGPRPGGR